MSMTHRQHSSTGRTCCICDRPCAILDCQCLENFQQNTSEHGNLMKRLTVAFSMPVSAKDLHSFSLCCSCEHHLVVIEQANRIKECIKQVFLETKEHRRFISNHMEKHGKPPSLTMSNRAKRLSAVFTDSRSFDEASPRVKRSRVSYSSSCPTTSEGANGSLKPVEIKPRNNSTSMLPVAEDGKPSVKTNKPDSTISFDSVFHPAGCYPLHTSSLSDVQNETTDTTSNMELEETASSAVAST